MVSTPCDSCGEPIFPGVRSCPHCGAANRFELKPLARDAMPVLLGALAVGGLTMLCAPRTKTISCVYATGPGAELASRSEPFTDEALASNEQFSLDPEAKQIRFPGSRAIKAEQIPYTVDGNTVVFLDRLGLKYVLDTKSGGLKVFSKAGQTAGYRLRGKASCTGL